MAYNSGDHHVFDGHGSCVDDCPQCYINDLLKRLERAVDLIASHEPPWFFKTEARTRRLRDDIHRQLKEG